MKKARRSWVSATALIAVGVLVAIQYGKVSPCIPDMMDRIGLSVSGGGYLMSAFAISALVISVVGGALIDKIGVRPVVLTALGVALLGNLIGIFSTSVGVLIFTRVLEGVGYGVVSVCGPVVISAWYPPEKRGIPNGLWGSYVGFGLLIATAAANPILANHTWVAVWVFAFITLTIAFFCFLLFVHMPDEAERQDADAMEENEEASLLKGFLAPGAVILAITFFFFDCSIDSFNNYSITYLNTHLMFDYSSSNLTSTIGCITMIIGSVIGSIILAHSKNRPRVFLITMILSTICMFMQFRLESSLAVMITYQAIAAAIYGAIPPMFYALVPETALSRKSVGAAVAVMILGQNLGTMIGPPIVGSIAESVSWSTSGILIGCWGIACIICILVFIKVMKKRTAKKDEA